MNEERRQLIKELLNIIGDYNMSQGLTMDIEHVNKWIKQFDKELRNTILRELIYIFKKTYLSRNDVKEYIKGILTSKSIFGDCIQDNIRNTTFLNIQKEGNSQNDLLEIVAEVLLEEYNIDIDECGSDSRYFYIDDCIFTGNKYRHTIEDWVNENSIKSGAELIVYHIAVYKQGEDYADARVRKLLEKQNIKLLAWRHLIYNNYKNNKFNNPIDALYPKEIQDKNVQAYIQDRLEKSDYAEDTKYFRDFDLEKEKLCSSQEARECLETEFLKVGANLVMSANQYHDSVRPMGFQKLESIGFGSMFVTYRNISNNCPLALWYGDVTKGDYTPLSKWYPLFPRVTYTTNNDDIEVDFCELAQAFFC
ncbi:phosphoribosyltransferase-like protein [Clostridium butyricum]|uniref:phosphoribosyltransferase-like protein n=1 Tax=Clostridium butyricum TaxID=1492 RepID=UPI002106B041|nr:hypothetical protein [Clostridium butyricum]MCQ2012342.1 hypothetical protein [Clostridium butyricum]MCQ2024709.1 hypothetical protein [Clostridium butyricum]